MRLFPIARVLIKYNNMTIMTEKYICAQDITFIHKIKSLIKKRPVASVEPNHCKHK